MRPEYMTCADLRVASLPDLEIPRGTICLFMVGRAQGVVVLALVQHAPQASGRRGQEAGPGQQPGQRRSKNVKLRENVSIGAHVIQGLRSAATFGSTEMIDIIGKFAKEHVLHEGWKEPQGVF